MMQKSFLLGSVAAVVSLPLVQETASAQSGQDTISRSVDYVRMCDAFGTGFHFIPGTETCLRFMGFIRTEIGVQDDADDPSINTSFMNSSFELVTTTVSNTEVGIVAGRFVIAGRNEGNVRVSDAWITIGENVLAGRATSHYDFGGGYGMYDGHYVDEGLNQFTFIMPIGRGVTFSLGLEDARDRQAGLAQVVNTGTVTVTSSFNIIGTGPTITQTSVTLTTGAYLSTSASYGGMEIPDIVAALRISQSWGTMQVSAAAHQIRSINAAAGPNQSFTTGVADRDWGFAVQAGIELALGPRTRVKAVGAYADGALHYVGGTGFREAVVGIDNGGSGDHGEIVDTLEGWYVLGAVEQSFGSNTTLALTGAYHEFIDQAERYYAGGTLTYRVVEDLFLRLGGIYQEIQYDPGALGALAGTGTEEFWQGKVRVQRNF